MICPYCGAFFCREDYETNPNPSVFCGRKCNRAAGKKAAKKRKREQGLCEQIWALAASGPAGSRSPCLSKRSYEDEQSALRSLVLVNSDPGREAAHPLTFAYQCDLCARWHLTSVRLRNRHRYDNRQVTEES